jgi:hypothetical protein
MPKNTRDGLSAGRSPVSKHPMHKDLTMDGMLSITNDTEPKALLRSLKADQKKAPKSKGKSK